MNFNILTEKNPLPRLVEQARRDVGAALMRFVFAVCLADSAAMVGKRRSRTREGPPQAEWLGDC